MAAAAPELRPNAFQLLPLGALRPTGWLVRQLRIQADGLGGHLDEFWPDVGPNSGWLGGSGESWERGPYFLDGLLPLAWLLDDATLKTKAMKFINWTLEHQQASGMIGPATNNDWWPRMVMVKVLAQYYEASSDGRVLAFLTRYFHYQLATLPQRPLESWGKYRWQDEAYIALWLYDRTHDPMLLELIVLLRHQGFDWQAQFASFRYTTATSHAVLDPGRADESMQTHGVNNAQALKVAAVEHRFAATATTQREAFLRQLHALDRFHGMPSGIFSADEHLGGLEPQHGTELCTVVETMFSLEVALAAFGEPEIADRIEKLAYNALPGTFTDDMWAHQYNQQSNQIQVGLLTRPWTTDGPESNLYGLEPNFGCCTANFHQGWPKFAASLWMKTPDDGLAATLYAPCELRTSVQSISLQVRTETEYPFDGKVTIFVEPASRLRFPLLLRIPSWAQGTTVLLNGKALSLPLQPGTFARIERAWNPGDHLDLNFPMQPRVSRWFNRSVAVERGPLVFSHSPGEDWVKLRDRGPTADWQVYPTKPWNYALQIDEASAASLEVTQHAVTAMPFSGASPAATIRVPAQPLDTWRSKDGVAAPPSISPVLGGAAVESLTLIPYAAAKLRVTAFPSLKS